MHRSFLVHCLPVAALVWSAEAQPLTPGAQENDPLVQTLKGGMFEFDRGITIGQAIDGYRYFTAKVWTPQTAANGRKTVEAAGTINFSRLAAKDLVGGAAAANGWAPELVAGDAKMMEQLATALANAQKGTKGAQVVFQFSLNLDDTFELKGGKINLVTADNRVLPVVLKEAETSAALKAVYEGQLPMHVMAVLLMGGAGASHGGAASPVQRSSPPLLDPSQGGLQPSRGL